MRNSHGSVLVLVSGLLGCTPSPSTRQLPPAHVAAIAESVRVFLDSVASRVTRDGPAGWEGVFVETSAFFLAAEGRVVFADPAAAAEGIQQLTRTISRLELSWGDSVRIDPLAPGLASVAAPYSEVLVDTAGQGTRETGYFTGLAQHGPGGWQLRNAHWSVAVAP